MELLNLPRLLLISGNGRDSGKTTFACRIISNTCRSFPVIALKISPHSYNSELNFRTGDPFNITEELHRDTSKDSSRMLAAGATRSYFITADDIHLKEVAEKLEEIAANGEFIICESGGLRKYVNPGLFFVINRKGNNEFKPALKDLPDKGHHLVTFDGKNFDLDPCLINRDDPGKKWIIR